MTDSTIRMNRLLEEVGQTVCADRNATHGDPYDQFGMTAALWSTVFGYKFSRADVALAMQLSKISRERHGQHNPDDDLDNLGYGLIKAAMKEMDRAAEEFDKQHAAFMACRQCRAVKSVEHGTRFKCECCGGKYGQILGEDSTS